MNPSTIYLIPNLLGEGDINTSLPPYVIATVEQLKHFIVEDEKSARKFLKTCGVMPPYNDIHLYRLDKHTSRQEKEDILNEIGNNPAGILSEAGCPAVVDPGSELVLLAHKKGLQVKPLVGPSSILLALMASGGNGQGFTFHGYLPAQGSERHSRLKALEAQARNDGYTHIFIETPFRNDHLLSDILQACSPDMLLSLAIEVTLAQEEIITRPIAEWKKAPKPELRNRPAVFSLWAWQGGGSKKNKYGKEV